jgi:hypothetical protein
MILSTCLESELRSVPREPGGMETREIFARAAEPTHHGAGFSFCEIEVLQCDNARSNGNRRLRIEQNLPGLDVVTDVPTIPALRISVKGKRYDFDAVLKFLVEQQGGSYVRHRTQPKHDEAILTGVVPRKPYYGLRSLIAHRECAV